MQTNNNHSYKYHTYLLNTQPTFNSDPGRALHLPPLVPGNAHVLPPITNPNVPQPQPGHPLPETGEYSLLPAHLQHVPVPHPLEGRLRVASYDALQEKLVSCCDVIVEF